jgi:uncharacterized protein YndB with AHSA1/START domain
MTAATPWGRVSRRGELFGLSFERIYSSTPEDVWEAVTDAERLARWMAPYRGDLRLGGRWEALDSEGSVFSWGTVSECEPPRRFVTSWEYEGEEPSRPPPSSTLGAPRASRGTSATSSSSRCGARSFPEPA